MDDRTIFLILYLGAGLLFSGIALPLLARKIPPNNWYGFRVDATLKNPKLWYEVNAYMARGMLVLGLVTGATALAGYFITALGLVPYFVVCTLVILVGLFVNLAQGFLFLKKL